MPDARASKYNVTYKSGNADHRCTWTTREAKENPPKKHRLSRIYTSKFSLKEEKLVKEGASTIIRHFRAYKTLSFKGEMGFIFGGATRKNTPAISNRR